MQDNKSISRDGTDKQNLPYSLGRFWPLWELKAISGWPLLAASVVKGLIRNVWLRNIFHDLGVKVVAVTKKICVKMKSHDSLVASSFN